MKKHILLILSLILALLLCSCGKNNQEAANKPQTDPTEETRAATPITWMTFEKNRELTASQYFVYNCESQEFVTISGELTDTIYPASITKLFTSYVALQFVSPEERITAGDELDLVISNSSVAEIKKGDTLTAEQLVEAMLLPSGNDAAYVLATHVGRKLLDNPGAGATAATEAFVAEMNRQASLLGMTDSNFANPDGIHKDTHYTTFSDIVVWGMLALEDPTILKYTITSSDSVTLNSGEKSWHNTNAIIDPASEYYCPCAIGLKTGQTPAAGSCLLSAFEYDGSTYLVGVFGCPEADDRFPDTLQLFNEAITR